MTSPLLTKGQRGDAEELQAPKITIPEPQKYVKIMAFRAIIMGLGPLFYTLGGVRY